MMHSEQLPTSYTGSTTFADDETLSGSHAAPLLIVGETADPRLVASQDALATQFERKAYEELSQYIKPSVIRFVAHSITSRMSQREGLNGFSYSKRGNELPDPSLTPTYSPDEVYEACERIKYGEGSPLQNELARQAFAMDSVEYANLTVIGESRKEFEDPMWEEVSKLTGKDARPSFEQAYGLQLLGFDRDITQSDHIGAMRIGMKRHLGETEFGTPVKVRTTAIVDTSPLSGFDTSLVELFRDTKRAGGDIAALPQFRNAVRWLVETQVPHGLVLARNETVYGFIPSAQKR